MDKFSITKLQQVQRLKSNINKIRDRMNDTPIPWTRIDHKSKPKRAPKQQQKPMQKHWTSKGQLTERENKYIRDNKLKICGECAEISREIKWAESYAHDDRVKACNFIRKKIADLIAENKNIFGYDRNKIFSDEEIADKIKQYAHYLFNTAIENGKIRYDEDLPGYVDEDGISVNEYDFKFSNCCREMAIADLFAEYGRCHKVGYAMDKRICIVESKFRLLEQSVKVREEFRCRAGHASGHNTIGLNNCYSINSFLLTEDKNQIINKLKSLPKNLTAKTYGVIITVLINDRIIRPITDGERGALYRALRDIYDDNRNIGTRQGVSKYICSAAVSDLDIAAAKELLA